jgi:hypothetical protein
MEEKGTSTAEKLNNVVTEFASRHKVSVRLARKFGMRWEFVAGGRNLKGLGSWQFSIDPDFSLFIEAAQFPEHLVHELTVLGEEIMKRVHEKGI